MLLPNALQKVLTPFACLFTKPTWQKAQVLLVGAVLTPRKRTVTAALRVLGLAQQRDFAKYTRVAGHRPPGVKPSYLVDLCGEPDTPWVTAQRLRYGWTVGVRYRRDAGATLGKEDQSQRHLPRRGKVEPQSFRQV